MKKFFSKIGVLLLVVMIISSCTIEKRRYLTGYSILTKGKGQSKDVVVSSKSNVKSDVKKDVAVVTEKKEIKQLSQTEVNKITEVETTKELSSEKPQRNKTKQNIKVKKQKKANGIYLPAFIPFQSVAKANGLLGTEKSTGGGKSQLVALLLCIFVGGIGIHRFYLGYTLIGVLQILTLGGCGIWALIDLIRIITGDLKPVNGRYSKTL